MSRLALLSDLHFSRHLRWDECNRVHDFIADDLTKRVEAGAGPDVIVCAGDLTDGATRPDERNALAAFIMKLAAIAPVVVVYGNHETPGDLDFLSHLRTPHPILVHAKPTTILVAGIALALLPWVHHVLPADDARRYNRAAAELAEARVIDGYLRKLGEGLDGLSWESIASGGDPSPRVFIGHAMIREALIKPGQPTRNNRDFLLPLSSLSIVRADIYLLGHVHHPQTLATTTGELVVYNGATRPTELGEEGPHGYTLVTFSPSVPPQVERVHTPITKITQVQDRWEEHNGTWRFGVSLERLQHLAKTSEVVFAYRVGVEQRSAAKTEAERIQAIVESSDGVIRLSPQIDVVVRARQPAIARTKSLAEKLSIWMRMQGKDPDSAECQRIHQKLASVVSSLGIRQTIGGMPRLHRMTIVGINPFQRPISIDLDALDGELVAIWGGNGEGKSTLLACYSALLYGTFPSAKFDGGQPLQRRMISDDAVIEGEFSTPTGRARIQHLVSRGSRFVFENGNATAVDKSGQVAPFKRWISENLLPRDVFHGSLFSIQGDEGVVNAGPSARKGLLLGATGNASLERVRDAASKFKAPAERAFIEQSAIVATTRTQLGSYPETSEGTIKAAEERRARADSAMLIVEQLRLDRASHDKELAERDVIAQEEREALRTRDECATRRKDIHATMLRADEIRKAVADLSEAIDQEAQLKSRRLLLESKRDGCRNDFVATRNEIANTDRRLQLARSRVTAAKRTLEDDAAVSAALSSLPILSTSLASADAHVAAMIAEERAVARRAEALNGERIITLRTGIEQICEALEWIDAITISTTAKGIDDQLVTQANPDAIRRAEQARAEAEQNASKAREALGKAREVAAREKEGQSLSAELETTIKELLATSARIKELRPTAALVSELERAEALGAEFERQEKIADDAACAAQAKIAARRTPPPPPPTTFSVGGKEWPLAEAIIELRKEISDATLAIGAAKENASKRVGIETRLATQLDAAQRAEQEFVEWRFLTEAFGRDAIQALEIDAANPELSLYGNDLLRPAFLGRYSLELTTQKETEGGTREDLLINITDAQQPIDHLARRDVSEWSGGQKTFFLHAFASAMSLYLSARSAMQVAPTIVRDETAAGVSIANATAYATMLRNAGRAIGGDATKTLVVTHSRELAELADVILHLENGELHVRRTV
jgi:DNA repair exonuclease SbcCD nuclease subunit/ABC-type lipoprotein export system ATPase subunit